MIEVSDQERRKIAQRLRENNDWRNSIRALWNALGIRPDVVETTSSYDYLEHNGKKIFNRIADLIDRPIVASRYVARIEDTSMLITGRSSQQLHCGNCSYTITRSYRYCPQCGVELKK